jgi:hypothetical protein
MRLEARDQWSFVAEPARNGGIETPGVARGSFHDIGARCATTALAPAVVHERGES